MTATAVVCHCVDLSTGLSIRWELGLLGAKWLLPEVVVFCGS